MRAPTYEVIQNLLIASATSHGGWVLVEGVEPTGQRCWLRIGLPSPQAAAERLLTVQDWQDQGIPVTYVRSPAGAALIDERAVFDRLIYG